jgi:outer membrane protein OmpA-like peptidoglycan-associated protein
MKTIRFSTLAMPTATLAMAALLAVPAFSQAAQGTSDPQAATMTTQAPDNTATASATGKPLSTKSNEGFWGHLNPLARKKWVNRQVNPIKDRLNELDQLSAKNASDIRDFDARAQAGIHQAQTTADQANSQAQLASNQANQAQMLATKANSQNSQLNSTVANLDQYQPITDTEIHFRPGVVVLNAKAKDALDQVATQLQGQKGYIVEVQGYSHARGQAGITTSQKLSDAVVRYLVVDHQIPVYRIHLIALGNAPISDAGADTTPVRGSLVHVTLMHNSLAALSAPDNAGSSPIGATQSAAQPLPQGSASQPASQQ